MDNRIQSLLNAKVSGFHLKAECEECVAVNSCLGYTRV